MNKKRGFVAFVPGLRGDAQIDEFGTADTAAPPEGSNAHEAYAAAQKHGLPFIRLGYQTEDRPFPTLSEMSEILANKLMSLQLQHEALGVVVAASTGVGVLLDAFRHGRSVTPNLVLYKGVYDPLSAIPQQAAKVPNGSLLYNAVKEGKTAQLGLGHDAPFPLPVEAGKPGEKPGIFPLRAPHLNDPHALRLFDPSLENQLKLRTTFGRSGRGIFHPLIIAAQDDPLSPPRAMAAFVRAVRPHITGGYHLKTVPGGHAGTPAGTLQHIVDQRLTELGY